MNDLLAEWISKAEGDYLVSQREIRVRKGANYNAVWFHCHQVVEEYMKAFLFNNGIDFPKTHDLIELLELSLPVDASFEFQRDLLKEMDRYAVRYRYPGVSADKEEARLALIGAKTLRTFLRTKIGLND